MWISVAPGLFMALSFVMIYVEIPNLPSLFLDPFFISAGSDFDFSHSVIYFYPSHSISECATWFCLSAEYSSHFDYFEGWLGFTNICFVLVCFCFNFSSFPVFIPSPLLSCFMKFLYIFNLRHFEILISWVFFFCRFSLWICGIVVYAGSIGDEFLW